MLPTKSNLIKLKKTIALSKQGQQLLEKKKFILLREKEKYKQEKENLEKEFSEKYKNAFLSLQNANVDLGIRNVKSISEEIELEKNLEIRYKTVMGVDIPITSYKKENKKIIPFGLLETSISLDNTIKNFNELKEILIKQAEIETTIRRLDDAIAKVQKRSNSLKDIIIQKYIKEKKQIEEILEERDREEFTRLKMLKRMI